MCRCFIMLALRLRSRRRYLLTGNSYIPHPAQPMFALAGFCNNWICGLDFMRIDCGIRRGRMVTISRTLYAFAPLCYRIYSQYGGRSSGLPPDVSAYCRAAWQVRCWGRQNSRRCFNSIDTYYTGIRNDGITGRKMFTSTEKSLLNFIQFSLSFYPEKILCDTRLNPQSPGFGLEKKSSPANADIFILLENMQYL